jgi:hypothetical protein
MWKSYLKQLDKSWFQTGIGLLVSGLVLLGCESADAIVDADQSVVQQETNVAALKSALDLSTEETKALSAAFAENEGRSGEPGYLWHIAGTLHDQLTSEEVQRFIGKATEARSERRLQSGKRNRQSEARSGRSNGAERFGPGNGNRSERGMMSAFTEEQKETARIMREGFQEQRKALVQQRNEGSLSSEDFQTQMKAMMQAHQEAFTNLLTEDQKAELEAHRAERVSNMQNRMAGEQTVMTEVLGLTADQVEALEALRPNRQQNRGEFRDRSRNRDMDRDAMMEAMKETRAEHRKMLEDILDESQLEIWDLHQSLQSGRSGRFGRGLRNGNRSGK